MKRLLGILALIAAIAGAFSMLGADEQPDGYRVRAVFDNASAAIAGEDVKIAGAVVGAIESLDVSPDYKAEIVLKIDEPAFNQFYNDASCTVRIQSLIGEKFIECDPGDLKSGALPESREHRGQDYLSIKHTSSPVDLDMLANTMRLPVRERFRLILNELGIGLSGRSEEINSVLRRANPALEELNKILAILARQNKELAALAKDGDAVMQQYADQRKHLSSTFDKAGKLQAGMLERRAALEASLEKFPRFLDELEPTMRQLKDFARESEPVVADLNTAADDISIFFTGLGDFLDEAGPALISFSDATEELRKSIPAVTPLIKDFRSFASEGRPAVGNLDQLLGSFDEAAGIENFMTTIFNVGGALNSFDDWGHVARASLALNVCLQMTSSRQNNCANDFKDDGGQASAASTQVERELAASQTEQAGAEAALDYVLGGER